MSGFAKIGNTKRCASKRVFTSSQLDSLGTKTVEGMYLAGMCLYTSYLESFAMPAMVILGLAAVQKKGFPLRKKPANKTMLANGVYMVFFDQYRQAKGYNSIDIKGKSTDY